MIMKNLMICMILLVYVIVSLCNAVEEWEEFFNDLPSEEGCDLLCGNGNKPVLDAEFTPDIGRCAQTSENILSMVTAMPEITGCCESRDKCFQTCGTSFRKCEEEYRQCLRDHAEDGYYTIGRYIKFKGMIQSPECSVFLAAQTKSCLCEDGKGWTVTGEPESPIVTFVPKKETPIKVKVVERGTPENKMVYIMPEDEDEDEYIRRHQLPDKMPHRAQNAGPKDESMPHEEL